MRRLLLIGAGHAHAQVLLDCVNEPLSECELVVVSPSPRAPYSGMVPGWLAGHYAYDDICIDFAALAAAAGARFVRDEVVGLDADKRRVCLAGGTALDYDLLSLNVGSTLAPPAVPNCTVLAMRPLSRLRVAWDAVLAECASTPADRALTITVVGGGPAGVESLLAVRSHLTRLTPERRIRGVLVSSDPALLTGLAPGAVRRLRAALSASGVDINLDTDWIEHGTEAGGLVLWATSARAHPWQGASGLSVSADGFIRIDRRLASPSHPHVFATGDCAEWAAPLPKAGVYAVRMGPVLSRNLRAALGSGTAVDYAPQRRVLALLATGDGRAVASWGRWSAGGRWVWRWKDRIDRAFVRRFAVNAVTAVT